MFTDMADIINITLDDSD